VKLAAAADLILGWESASTENRDNFSDELIGTVSHIRRATSHALRFCRRDDVTRGSTTDRLPVSWRRRRSRAVIGCATPTNESVSLESRGLQGAGRVTSVRIKAKAERASGRRCIVLYNATL